MRLFFACMLGAAACAVWSSAALSWDGAYMLYKALDDGAPFIPLGSRHVHAVLQAPAVAARLAGVGNFAVLRALFVAPFALAPFAGLLLAWQIVRVRRPELFVWPVISVTLANLPGAFFLVSEGPIAVALFWPVVLALLVGPISRAQLAGVVVAALLVLLSHPIAAPLFAGAGLLALFLRARRGPSGAPGWPVGALFLALAAARALVPLGDYETRNLSVQAFTTAIRASTWGWPRVSLAMTAGVTILLAAHPRVLARLAPGASRLPVPVLATALALAAGAAMAPWASDPARWASALNYRFAMNVLSAGFLILATIEGIHPPALSANDAAWMLRARRGAIGAAGIAFLLLFALEGRSWRELCHRFAGDVESASGSCVSLSELPSTPGTALTHWGTPSLAIVLQGREPRRLALFDGGCAALARGGDVPLAPWDSRPADRGWFRLPR
jgi:hypothetical protein